MGIKWIQFLLMLAYFDCCCADVSSTEMITSWIWSEGCRKLDSKLVILNETASGPAECLYKCGNLTDSIAVQGHLCRCLKTFTSQQVYEVCDTCNDEPELFCGRHQDDMWSLYRKGGKEVRVSGNHSDADSSQPICIAVQKVNETFEMKTKPCQEKIPFLCRDSSGTCLPDTDLGVRWSKTPSGCQELSASTINSLRLLEFCVIRLSESLYFKNAISNFSFWIGLRQITFKQSQMPTQLLQTTTDITSMTVIYARNNSVFSPSAPSNVKAPMATTTTNQIKDSTTQDQSDLVTIETQTSATSEAGLLTTSENVGGDREVNSTVPTISTEEQHVDTVLTTSSKTGQSETLSSTSESDISTAILSGTNEVQTTPIRTENITEIYGNNTPIPSSESISSTYLKHSTTMALVPMSSKQNLQSTRTKPDYSTSKTAQMSITFTALSSSVSFKKSTIFHPKTSKHLNGKTTQKTNTKSENVRPATTSSLLEHNESKVETRQQGTSSTYHRRTGNGFGVTSQIQNEATTENKSVQATSPGMAVPLPLQDEMKEMKEYYAAFGASVLVLLIIIIICLALVNRSIRKLTKCRYSSRRRRGGSRDKNRYRRGSTTILTDEPSYRSLRRDHRQINGTHQNFFDNHEYQWDHHSSADELHDHINDNICNRRDYLDGNYNRHALTLHRQRGPSPLHSGFTSTGRLQSEWF